MGRMKELFMAERERELQRLEIIHAGVTTEPILHIPCPNCFNKTLLYKSTTDINCVSQGCGQKFVLVNANTVRYA